MNNHEDHLGPSTLTAENLSELRERAAFEARFPGCRPGSPNKDSPECEAGWDAWRARSVAAASSDLTPENLAEEEKR